MKDINKIKSILKETIAAGGTRADGFRKAGEHFGVSEQATYNRLHVYEQGKHLSGLKKKTTKIPIEKRNDRKPHVKHTEFGQNRITLDIKNVIVDLENKKLTIIY